jgi:NAD(P)-dependent dehydrogenase (short-subunit alcohol dehydrogenase family)
METKSNKTVAITGAGSGLGKEIAIGFAAKGYKVFGTAFSQQEIDGFQKTPGTVELTVTDITKEEDVIRWVKVVTSSIGKKGLDILVNNAGVLTPGPMELLPLNVIRHEFEVNVFGSLAVTNAFLPLLRTAKGRIVQIGSFTGRFPLPFSGPSSASKATLEAFAEVYRLELKPFHVDYILVQPGNLLTGGPAKTAALLQKVSAAMTPEQNKLYGERFKRFSESLNRMQSEGLPAAEAAEQVIEIAEHTPAPIRATVGTDAAQILQMVREKSDEELDAFRLKLLNI